MLFPEGKMSEPSPSNLLPEAVAYVLVAVEELEVSAYFDPVLIDALENHAITIVYLGLSLDLVVFPDCEDLVAVAVGLRQFAYEFEAGSHAYLFEFLHLLGTHALLFLELALVLLVLLVLHEVEFLHEFGLKRAAKPHLDGLVLLNHFIHPSFS